MKAIWSGLSRSGLLFLALFISACAVQLKSGERDGVQAIGLTPEDWTALSKPGSSHRLLESFVGEWDVELTFWSDPDSAGESSLGHSQISWILGKRFLQEQFSGTLAGADYRGMGIMGYDNAAKRFKTVWADSLNTALTTSSGRFSPDGKTVDLESEVYDPLVSGLKVVQSKLQIESADSYTFFMTDTSPEGKKFKSLEMRYRRVAIQDKIKSTTKRYA
jgi:hypothetical protein